MSLAPVATVVPILLELDPLVNEALSDPLLSSSLWLMVALMGFATLLYVYLGRGIEDERLRLIFVATIGIPSVSIASYLGLASGLTMGVVTVGGQEQVTMWGRYLTWTFSTPLILLALGLLARSERSTLLTLLLFDIAMCLTGLAAALTSSAVWLRWTWFFLSTAFFVVVLYVLVGVMSQDAARQSQEVRQLFSQLRNLTVVLWLGYPIVWALGVEGLGIIASLGASSWLYSLLDVGAKFVFAFLLLRGISENPAAMATGERTGEPTPTAD